MLPGLASGAPLSSDRGSRLATRPETPGGAPGGRGRQAGPAEAGTWEPGPRGGRWRQSGALDGRVAETRASDPAFPHLRTRGGPGSGSRAGSPPGCALGGAGEADTVAFWTHRAAGRQKARARGSVWSRICALGGDRAGSGVPAEGLHFPEGSGTAVSVLGRLQSEGRTAGLPSRPRDVEIILHLISFLNKLRSSERF